MTALTAWLLLFLMLAATIRFLPFIDLEASVRLEFWLRDLLRKLDRFND
jgi:hypothetical protein